MYICYRDHNICDLKNITENKRVYIPTYSVRNENTTIIQILLNTY